MIGECGVGKEVKLWKLCVLLLPTPAVFEKDVLILEATCLGYILLLFRQWFCVAMLGYEYS